VKVGFCVVGEVTLMVEPGLVVEWQGASRDNQKSACT